jgi:hypothetical protein
MINFANLRVRRHDGPRTSQWHILAGDEVIAVCDSEQVALHLTECANTNKKAPNAEWLQMLAKLKGDSFNVEQCLSKVQKDILDLFRVSGPKLLLPEIIKGLKSNGITVEHADLKELLENLKEQGHIFQSGFTYILRTPPKTI